MLKKVWIYLLLIASFYCSDSDRARCYDFRIKMDAALYYFYCNLGQCKGSTECENDMMKACLVYSIKSREACSTMSGLPGSRVDDDFQKSLENLKPKPE
ncbi:MAG: hypothetical protein H7A23_07035 [Leptospiraceae bacterium]|nr:hypothetical protein [Leptospiraceae bacterium]MCP5494293.1 hypothetical protein [Leptospiraceae bacterium]